MTSFRSFRFSFLFLVTLLIAALWVIPAAAKPPAQDSDDPVQHGEYLTTIAGCWECHTITGFDLAMAQLEDPSDLSALEINGYSELEQLLQPEQDLWYAGGRAFALGPIGVVFSKNLTPDPETGLGDWTDDEIKLAISTGRSPDGLALFPLMPYPIFNNMAESDLDAIVAFLRTLEPVENVVPREQILPPEALPQLTLQEGGVAPDPSDTAARGEYLMTAVLACTDCHTPVDPETGQPIREMYLGGGQPYEGPWGIVYGGNITPDEETGLGSWSDDDIKRLLRNGIRPDGRRVVLMPWQMTANLSDADLDAVVYYLRNNVPPVENEVPAASLNEGFAEFVELPAEQSSNFNVITGVVGAVVILIVGGGLAMLLRRRPASS